MGIYDATVSPFSGLSAAPPAPTGARVVSGKTMAQRPGAIASAVGGGRVVSGQTMAKRPGVYVNQGDVESSPPTRHGSITSAAVGTDPSRFGGHNSYSKTPYPVYGPADTGDMPDIQRAFAKDKENSGITQLLPNLSQKATKGTPSLTTPQLSRVTGGSKAGFTPGEIINIQRESENQLQQEADARRQLALNYTTGNMKDVTKLYGAAHGETAHLGDQAYERINEQEQNNLAASQGNLIARGLGNSTIGDTVGHLYRREANDARLGVDESKAKMNIGLDTQLADNYYNNGSRVAGLLTGGTPTDASQQALDQFGQAKASNNIAKSLLAQGGGQLIGSAAGGAGSALGSAAGAGIGAIGGLIAGLF